MSAYIRQLQECAAAHSAPASRRDPLRERLLNWFTRLPAPTRNRPFAMQEFEAALGTTGRYISPVLVALGWRRKRIWSTPEHYHRFWLPPSPSAMAQNAGRSGSGDPALR